MSAENSGVRLEPAQGELAIRFQLQYGDVEAFVRGYAVNLSAAGMFIAAREPPAIGTTLQFAVVLADEQPLLRGEGQVVWTADPAAPAAAPAAAVTTAAPGGAPLCGFGLRFGRLTAASRAVVEKVLAYKAAHPEQFFVPIADPYAGPGSPRTALPPGSAAAVPPPVPPVPPALAARPLGGPSAGLPAEEEAALQALLQPAPPPPLSAPADTARLLDALLDRDRRSA